MPKYDIGDKPVVTVQFADIAGVPTSPTTVTFLVLKPDGTVTSSGPSTGPTSGVATLTLPTLDQAGTWYVRCKGTGACVAAVEEWFDVTPSAFPSP